MKILLVGSSGTIGAAVSESLARRGHHVIGAHRSSTQFPVDLGETESIQRLLDQVGELDAVACAAGRTPYAQWDDLDRETWMSGINSKFLGQVELVRRATRIVRPGGSFTVISGVLAREPIRTGTVGTAVNCALEGWVRASAAELWGRFRVNAVSPTILRESVSAFGHIFPGFPPTNAGEVAEAYVRSLETMETGRIYKV